MRGFLASLILATLLWAPLAARGQTVEHPAAPVAPAAHGGTAPAGEHNAAGAEEEAKPALLQFDPGAAVWTIIVFLVLLVVLRAAAWKPMLRVLNERERFIEKSIADAKSEREKAQKLLADYQQQLDRAREQASAIVAEGRRDAEVAGRRIHEDARHEAEELLQRARREIQLAADSARKQLHDEASDLAVRVARGILGRELTTSDHSRLVQDSIQAMQATGNGKTG